MPTVEFVGQSSRDDDNASSNTSRLVNVYREGTGDGKKVLKSVLGMEPHVVLGGVFVRAMTAVGPHIYALCGGRLWRIAADGSLDDLGAVDDSEDASISSNGGDVTIASGGKYYLWDGSALTQPATGAFTDFGSVCYGSRYTILTERNGRRFCWSDLADPATLPGLNFSEADGQDDDILRAMLINGALYFLKTQSHEIWYVTGEAGASAFARTSGGVREVGLASVSLIAQFTGAAFMVGSDGRAHLVSGGALQPISTPAVETAIKLSEPKYCLTYDDEGHTFCAIVFGDRAAWVYDVATGEWHERAEGASLGPWSASCAVKLGSRWFVGRDGGEVSQLGRRNRDGEKPLVREATSKTLENDGQRFVLSEFELIPRRGYSDGVMSIATSRDFGATWTAWKERRVGPVGNHAGRVIWRGLGQFRQCTVKVRWTDPADMSLSSSARVVI